MAHPEYKKAAKQYGITSRYNPYTGNREYLVTSISHMPLLTGKAYASEAEAQAAIDGQVRHDLKWIALQKAEKQTKGAAKLHPFEVWHKEYVQPLANEILETLTA